MYTVAAEPSSNRSSLKRALNICKHTYREKINYSNLKGFLLSLPLFLVDEWCDLIPVYVIDQCSNESIWSTNRRPRGVNGNRLDFLGRRFQIWNRDLSLKQVRKSSRFFSSCDVICTLIQNSIEMLFLCNRSYCDKFISNEKSMEQS